MIGYVILLFAVIGMDQYTKYLAYNHLRGGEPKLIIEKLLEFSYVENRGAAFGILQGKSWFFLIVTFLVCIILTYYLVRYYDEMSILTKLCLILIMAGAIGNLIDRIARGFVVDFIFVRFWGYYDFPLFNVADMAVVIGSIGLMLLILFSKEVKMEW
ncbi:MAG: signal peptidase II [Tissierellia bacterium]|nr:signal peptidase II [Tissierellia bacterium]